MLSLRNQDKVRLKDEDRGSGQKKTILKGGRVAYHTSLAHSQHRKKSGSKCS